jgi:hypothetical protein
LWKSIPWPEVREHPRALVGQWRFDDQSPDGIRNQTILYGADGKYSSTGTYESETGTWWADERTLAHGSFFHPLTWSYAVDGQRIILRNVDGKIVAIMSR